MLTYNTVFQATRPKFLLLAPICVGLGAAYAGAKGFEVDNTILALCVIISLLSHASVNLLNEYQDAKSGLDNTTTKTPFSGGSGALQKNPSALNAVFWSGIVCCVAFSVLGVWLASMLNWQLVLFGLIGLVVIVSYTPWLNKTSWLCLISPGTGFGLLFVIGTYAVFAESITPTDVAIALPVFFLVNNLLLLNQFPDVTADRDNGRNHFVIRYGYSKSAIIYIVSACLAFLAIALLVHYRTLPFWSLSALLFFPVALAIGFKAMKFEQAALQTFLPLMGLNVMVTLLTPSVLALSLIIA
ncbi:prenyltransferase [Alteromonas sediminis]